MTSVMCTPFIPISFQVPSHRAAQGVIYADMLKHMGHEIEVYMSKSSVQGEGANEDNKTEDFNRYDSMFVYHGNDFRPDSKDVNLFGGVKEFPHAYNTRNFSWFKGKVYSLVHDFPNYADRLELKFNHYKNKHGSLEGVAKEFLQIDFDNLRDMEKRAETITPWIHEWEGQVIGDSHAICMYRPGYNPNSIPFKTLHGALKSGLESLIIPQNSLRLVEFYFGNIDVRHHVCRLGDVKKIIEELVVEYIRQVSAMKYDRKVIYELLPIENESRTIPKSGWYEGQPFWGSWAERNEARLYFNDFCEKSCAGTQVDFVRWVPPTFYNASGEMDFAVMEKPKSVHLSRAHYPYWQGLEYNKIKKPSSLEDFFS